MGTPKNAVPVLMEKPEEKVKPVYVDELDIKSNIGFVFNGDKCLISKIGVGLGEPKFAAHYGISENGYFFGGCLADTPQGVIQRMNHHGTSVGVTFLSFNTRRDLYKWLAED